MKEKKLSGSTFFTQRQEHSCRSICKRETHLQCGGKKRRSTPRRHPAPRGGFRPALRHSCRQSGAIPAGKAPRNEPGPLLAPAGAAHGGLAAEQRAGGSPRGPTHGIHPGRRREPECGERPPGRTHFLGKALQLAFRVIWMRGRPFDSSGRNC